MDGRATYNVIVKPSLGTCTIKTKKVIGSRIIRKTARFPRTFFSIRTVMMLCMKILSRHLEEIVGKRASRNFLASAVYTSQRFVFFFLFFFRCMIAAESETGWSLNFYREADIARSIGKVADRRSARKVFASLPLLLDSGHQDASNTSYPRKENFRCWRSKSLKGKSFHC